VSGKRNKLERRAQEQAQGSGMSVEANYKGPIPPPSMLREFDQVYPGLADRIVKMAEVQIESQLAEQKHIHTQEAKIVDANIRDIERELELSARGQWLMFVVLVLLIIVGTVLLIMGKDVQGSAAIVLAIIALAGQFILRVRKEKSDSNSKK
jgi:uncharacterized membrane protein